MTAWDRWRRLAWPLAGVVWLWIDLGAGPATDLLAELGATTGLLILAAATAIVARVLDRPDHAAARRRVETGLLILLVVAGLTIAVLRPVAVTMLVTIVWVGLLRLAPRFGVMLIALVLAANASLVYFGIVLFAVGLLLIPGSLAGYLREIVPGRIGSVP